MKKKGFTLIELLAVIVILAVIALIATPMILGIIDDAKKKANKEAANGILEAAKLYYVEMYLNGGQGLTTNYECTFSDGIGCTELSLKGKLPKRGTIEINSNGLVNGILIFEENILYICNSDIKETLDSTCNFIDYELVYEITDEGIITGFKKVEETSYLTTEANNYIQTKEITIPEYVGNIEVEGIASNAFSSYEINKIIILSNKVLTIGGNAFPTDLEKLVVKSCFVNGYSEYANILEEMPTDCKLYDKEAPIFQPMEDITIEQGETVDLTTGVVVTDNLTGLEGTYTYAPEIIDTSVAGETIVTYKAIDKAGNIGTATRKVIVLNGKNDSILGYIDRAAFNNDTIENITINNETYSAHIYTYEGDQIWDSNMVFGDSNDVGTSTADAKNMVIVKVNGDLTINNDVNVTTYADNYGGPKGFILYVTGTLTNKGTIDNSNGAKAAGQNVYLWQNSVDNYEYIPATGAIGGDVVVASSSKYDTSYTLNGSKGYHLYGDNGDNGSDRQTGGGGSGGATVHYTTNTASSGAGSSGTSYSGGSGGGGAVTRTDEVVASEGISGGSGGNAKTYTNTGSVTWIAGGGAGLPGGNGYSCSKSVCTDNTNTNGTSGTGGLLVIYANSVDNTGSITAKGSIGGGGSTAQAPGGSSGGGSINIFYKNAYSSTGIVSADGGESKSYTYRSVTIKGGAGGTGTITIGCIKTGKFVKD